jgi:hypothetical protein
MADAAAVLNQHLYDNWSLTSPAKVDIYWAKSKVEAVDFTKMAKNYVVACYAPMTAANIRTIAKGVMLVEQNVMVDILVKVVTSVNDAVNARENMRNEVYRILKESTPNGFQIADIIREFNKVESPDLARLSLQVKMVSLA